MLIVACWLTPQSYALKSKDIEGKWCAKPNSVIILGAYDGKDNPTTLKSVCLEYKIEESDEDGGVGRYLVTKTQEKKEIYPIKRHPLEKQNQQNGLYEIVDSPGLFSFILPSDSSMVIKDQSLSRNLLTANGHMTASKSLLFSINYRPKNNQMEYASVAYMKLKKVSNRVDRGFDDRWKKSKSHLKDVLKDQRIKDD